MLMAYFHEKEFAIPLDDRLFFFFLWIKVNGVTIPFSFILQQIFF